MATLYTVGRPGNKASYFKGAVISRWTEFNTHGSLVMSSLTCGGGGGGGGGVGGNTIPCNWKEIYREYKLSATCVQHSISVLYIEGEAWQEPLQGYNV